MTHAAYAMQPPIEALNSARYARCIEASKRVRWDIDRDVLRGRTLDPQAKFLPDALAQPARFALAGAGELRFLSQVQGRTYAGMFALAERLVSAKMLELARGHALGDPVVLEALVRFTGEELKHQELFRRLEALMHGAMPPGYRFVGTPEAGAAAVLARRTWAVLGYACLLERATLEHHRLGLDGDAGVSEVWRDVLLFHMREEAQHALLDEMEWQREDAAIAPAERARAAGDLAEILLGMDRLLQAQAAADAGYFAANCGRALGEGEARAVRSGLLDAYRWQYIVSGVRHPRFVAVLEAMLTSAQLRAFAEALAPVTAASR